MIVTCTTVWQYGQFDGNAPTFWKKVWLKAMADEDYCLPSVRKIGISHFAHWLHSKLWILWLFSHFLMLSQKGSGRTLLTHSRRANFALTHIFTKDSSPNILRIRLNGLIFRFSGALHTRISIFLHKVVLSSIFLCIPLYMTFCVFRLGLAN